MRIRIPNNWSPRHYQLPLWRYLEQGGREAAAVWHRRAGKDEVALHWECIAAHKRPAVYWHMLPEAAQARKAIWDAVNPHTGIRRIDEAFPHALRASTREHEMAIRFKSGSIWQVVGSDNFNSLVGAPPAGIVYSEWAIAKPAARAYLRPIIAENKGWELFIYTPRGRNHGLTTYESCKENPKSFAQKLTVDDTGILDPEFLAQELKDYIREYGEDEGEAFFKQEYYTDFNAPLLGAILGRYVDRAEQEGRLCDVEYDEQGSDIEISSDIGFYDTASWWFWQRKPGGFAVIDYTDGTGMDADDWIEKLKTCIGKRKLGKIWLPHDARAKTFQSKHSVLERFIRAFGAAKVAIVPRTSKADRINAARTIIPRVEINETKCRKGIEGLRSWVFKWDEDKKIFSKEPQHDWASHPGDAFSYGAQMMREYVLEIQKKEPMKDLTNASFEELWEFQPEKQAREI